MRLNRISLRGLTRFSGAQPITVDLEALGPGLVAVVGPNGAGKSTLLEAAPLALYRTAPSRPAVYDACHGRDAFAEVVFTDDAGNEVKVRLQIDADRRTAEQYVFVNGMSTTNGRAKEAEGEVARRFGSYELLLASVFATQGKTGNFLALSKTDRKALFVELLGLGHLETMAAAAKDRRATAERAADQARALVTRGEGVAAQAPAADEALTAAQAAVEAAAGKLATAREEEAAAIAAVERVRSAGQQLQALQDVEAAARRELDAARAVAQEQDVEERKARARRDAAVRGLAEPPDQGRIRARHEAQRRTLAARRLDLERTVAESPAVDAASARVVQLVQAREVLELAAANLDRLRGEERVAAAEHSAAVKAAETIGKAHRAELDRLALQSELLQKVPCTDRKEWVPRLTPGEGAQPPVDLAGACPLLADARGALRRAEELRREDPEAEARQALLAAERKVARLQAQVKDASAAVDQDALARIRREEQEARKAEARRDAITEAVRQMQGLAGEEARLADQLTADIEDAVRAAVALTAERARIEDQLTDELMDLADRRSAAQERLAAADARHRTASGELEAARLRLDASDLATAQGHLRAAQEQRGAAERALRDADARAAGAQGRVEDLRRELADLELHRSTLRAAEVEVGDWALLERALGRDGVQALEIDAAGPEVARLTNELLQACYGPRFSIAFETLREKKSAPGQYTEAFDVQVYDHGTVRPVEALSGGERVVVSEAIGLALSIFTARKSGVRWQTAFRDETAGALDPENAGHYVDMLRKAMAMAGLYQLLFVSHSEEVQARADVRLIVQDGTVRVDGAREAPARAEAAVA